MHSAVIVICDQSVSDIRAEAALLLAPFNSEIEVPDYLVQYPDSYARNLMVTRGVTTLGELAEAFKSDRYSHFFIKDDVVCSCSSINPQGHWDYYSVGGYYSGRFFDLESGLIGRQRNWDAEVCENLSRPNRLGADSLPAAIVTPEGEWFDLLDHGWCHSDSEERRLAVLESWKTFTLPFLNKFDNHLALCLDVHS